MKKIFFLFLVTTFSFQLTFAQQLLTPSLTYSHKKTAYATLLDGTEITGHLKDLKRKKGLIKAVKIQDGDGKNHKLKPQVIKHMYLPQTNLDKLSKAVDFVTDVQKWNDQKLDQDLLNQGYVFFENARVKVKKKEMTLMMQLLNPDFSKAVKVYHDPFANESISLELGGVKVAGGHAKSYYIAKGKEVAFRLKKKHYKTEFPAMWGSCSQMKEQHPEMAWADLVEHIIDFSACK